MMRVIFDSSFLMAVAERPTTWFEDITEEIGRFEPVILECVVEEIERMASGEGRKARTARAALEIARYFVRVPCGGAAVDDEIVSASHGRGKFVATVDSGLLETLEKMKVRTVSLGRGRVFFH